MGVDVAEVADTASPLRRRRRWQWPAIVAACLVAAYLIAISSTHSALRAGAGVNWAGSPANPSSGLGPITSAELAQVGPIAPGNIRVLWASRPGGEFTIGFQLHNENLVPITILGVTLPGKDPGPADALTLAGTLLGPDSSGAMAPFHPITLGAGASATIGLTDRVGCEPNFGRDVRTLRAHGVPPSNFTTSQTGLIVVRYRALGLTSFQTVRLANPIEVVLPYSTCM